MLSISYISAILVGIALFLVGWFISQTILKKKNEQWKLKYKEADAAAVLNAKKIKKQDQQIKDLRHKCDSWKQEFQIMNKESQNLKKDHASFLQQNDLEKSEIQKQLSRKDSDNTVLNRSVEKMKKDLEQMKEKYNRDMADSKQWKSERSTIQAELSSLQNKLSKVNAIAVDYKKKYESQEDQISKINELNRELRGLRARSKKLDADCVYWEKKHYDTHHELATLKKSEETWRAELNQIKELRKGDQILKDNLLSQIQEFKSKFLSVSDKYRELSKN